MSSVPLPCLLESTDGLDRAAVDDARAIENLAQARLLSRAASGDREAVETVWRQNRRWLAAVLAVHAPRGADVEDLLQEVAAVFLTKAREIRDAASLRSWLRVVAVNEARMAARDKHVERRSWRGVVERSRIRETPSDLCASDVAETLASLSRLPAIYAEPLMLQSAQGLSQRQIAQLLGVPETTVETRLARARRMLRTMHASSIGTNKGSNHDAAE